MGELELLNHIYAANTRLPASVSIPPGDDMAAIDVDGQTILIGVDQIADGVHFNLASASVERVGAKAVKRSLSDVAAMAGSPTSMVVSATLPRHMPTALQTRLNDAIVATAHAYACPVVGGDVMFWDHPLALSVTVLATAPGHAPISRRGAEHDDRLFVTGTLGGSGEEFVGKSHHLDFEPRIELARHLVSLTDGQIRCMIDLSDGLASDVTRLCEQAANKFTAVELVAEQLPISDAAQRLSRRDGRAAWEHAVADGEDYELCFAVPASVVRKIPAEILGVPITPVGRFLPWEQGTPRVSVRQEDGTIATADGMGWEHGD